MANENSMHLSVKGMCLALGLVWGLSMLVAGWFSMFGWGSVFVDAMASVYLGYSSTFFGAIRGAIWGFVDGAIGGALLAYFYNYFTGRAARKRSK